MEKKFKEKLKRVEDIYLRAQKSQIGFETFLVNNFTEDVDMPGIGLCRLLLTPKKLKLCWLDYVIPLWSQLPESCIINSLDEWYAQMRRAIKKESRECV